MSTAREDFERIVEEQPDDSSSEEIPREIAFHTMIQRGLAYEEAGRVISHEEMGRRFRSWRK